MIVCEVDELVLLFWVFMVCGLIVVVVVCVDVVVFYFVEVIDLV